MKSKDDSRAKPQLSAPSDHTTQKPTAEVQKQLKRVEPYEAIQRKVQAINRRKKNVSADEEAFFQRLKISRRIRLSDFDLRRIKTAVEARNVEFLERLAKIVKSPHSPFKVDLTLTERFLREKWGGFHHLSEAALLDEAVKWCKEKGHHTGSISAESLSKTRQRLGFFKKPHSK